MFFFGFHNYYIAQEFILFEHIKLMGGRGVEVEHLRAITPGMDLFEHHYFTEQCIILTSKLNLNFSLQNSCTPHVLNVRNRPR